jgi:xanthine dehydrogenase YagT iron-sulfur-binding subunit
MPGEAVSRETGNGLVSGWETVWLAVRKFAKRTMCGDPAHIDFPLPQALRFRRNRRPKALLRVLDGDANVMLMLARDFEGAAGGSRFQYVNSKDDPRNRNSRIYRGAKPMENDDRFPVSLQPSRRQFLLNTGSTVAAGVLAAYAPAGAATGAAEEAAGADVPAVENAVPITLRINGKGHQLRIDPRTTLLDCLRETVALTGTKKGCDHGQCGACTVHVNGRRVLSCLNFAVMHDGEEITTIEGLGTPEAMHPMQEAFFTHDAYQCGYCTSGQIMSAVALLREPCGPDDAAVKELMSGNICRCGAYSNIVAAIQQVRKRA